MQMNLEHGLNALKMRLQDGDPDLYLRFTTLEGRLRENVEEERDFGIDASLRSQRTRIRQELNRLALTHCQISFNDLCRRDISSIVAKQEQTPLHDERGATMDSVKLAQDNKRRKREVTTIRKRWGLLVGVNRYVDPQIRSLDYAVNDVLAMEKLLQKANYEVIALHDKVEDEHLLPTRDNVEAELRQLCQKAEPNDLVLVYFATHGKLVDGKPRLITREIRYDGLANRALPLSVIIQIMYERRIKRRVLLLDACHSGIDMTRDLTIDEAFIHDVHELAEGTALLAATTAQDKAFEHKGLKHGLFTNALLKGIEGQADHDGKGFVTIDDLKKHVQHTLSEWNSQHYTRIQQPTVHIQGFGDMILADYRP